MESLPGTIRACRHLQELILWFPRAATAEVERDLADAVLEISPLRTFEMKTSRPSDIFWHRIMRGLARLQLPTLRSLAGVWVDEEVEPTLVGALSQLTYLGWDLTPGWLLPHLTRLSALRALHGVSHDGGFAVFEGVRPLVQLQELRILDEHEGTRAFSIELVTQILAALPALTKLGVYVSAPTMPPIPHALVTDGFARLRSLSIVLGGDVEPDQLEAVAGRLSGLKSLTVLGGVRLCAKFLSCLPPMPQLTELSASGLEEGDISEVVCAPGRFLAGLPRLRRLQLSHVLDVFSWDEDARYIAELTDLRKAFIWQRCHVHFNHLVKAFKLQPPVPLWQLQDWVCLSCPCSTSSARSPFLCEARKDLRHAMGLPRMPRSSHNYWWRIKCGMSQYSLHKAPYPHMTRVCAP
jgi:hypothetical protein